MPAKMNYKKKYKKKYRKKARKAQLNYLRQPVMQSDTYHTSMIMLEDISNDYTNGFALRNNPISGAGTPQINQKNITFQMFMFNGFATYRRIFEEYRVNKIVVKFRPVKVQMLQAPVSSANPGAIVPGSQADLAVIPKAYYAIDRNDDAPRTEEEFRAYRNVTIKPANKSHTIKFCPSILTPQYAQLDPDGNPLWAYTIDYEKRWVQLNQSPSNELTYWGIKYAIENAAPEGRWKIEPTITCYISFRGKKV